MKGFKFSRRLQSLPPYLFTEIDRHKRALKSKGINFIDLSIGDPDIPAPFRMVDALYECSKIKEYQKYPLDAGLPSFKVAIRDWFKNRFSVNLDAESQILPLIGSKEGLVHFPLAFINPQETIIIPSPGYPGYRSAAVFSNAKIYEMPLLEKNGFLPDLNKIPLKVKNKAKLIYVNYPNNPTSVLASRDFLESLVKFCLRYGIIICYDNAYSEVYFDEKPLSVLEIKGAADCAIEFHSLSKTFCVTGFRTGWACGNATLVKGLAKAKTNIDSGLFLAIQKAAEVALNQEHSYAEGMRKIIRGRRDALLVILKNNRFDKIYCDSTFYVWAKLPKQFKSSIEYSKYLLVKKNIVVTPGIGFGKYGEGYVRFALTVDKDTLSRITF